MTTDKNKVSEPLVSDEWIEEQGDVMSKSIVEFGGTPEQGDQDAETWMGAARCVRYVYEAELSRLRQERDELLGALEATWSALEASPCDPDITADQIAAHAELKKHDVMALLSKHKPE